MFVYVHKTILHEGRSSVFFYLINFIFSAWHIVGAQ